MKVVRKDTGTVIKGILALLLLIAIALLFFPGIEAFSCNVDVTASCVGTTLLYMENDTGGFNNAHAQLVSEATYANSLCCEDDVYGYTIGTDCGSTTFLQLYSVSNSHVQQNNYSTYTNDACISVSSGGTTCVYRDDACVGSEECLVSIASTAGENGTNAHVGDCNEYARKVCCSLNLPPINPTVYINSTDGTNITTQDLNCYATINDPEGDVMNVTVKWYLNGTLNVTLSYNNNSLNGTFFVSTQGYENTTIDDNWSCSIQLNDSLYVSHWGNSTNLTVLSDNSAPTNPTVYINSTDGTNTSSQDLNCYATLTDTDGNTMNVTVKWYINSTLYSTDIHNEDIKSGYQFNATQGYENTTKNDWWNCSMEVTDGSENSSVIFSTNITILNSLPTTPTLEIPTNANSTMINRNVTFNWSDSTDIDGDSITYIINVSNAYCANFDNNSLTTSEYTHYELLSTDYECLGNDYVWNVSSCDADGCSISSTWTFSIADYLAISITNSDINFGTLSITESNDTTNDDPLPFLFENIGNTIANMTNANASSALFSTVALNKTNFQLKADNSSEIGSFNYSASITTWQNITIGGYPQDIVAYLNYTDANDEVEIDIRVEVPSDEPGGVKSTTINFEWSDGI